MTKCETDCREELIGMMVTKAGLKWAVGIIVTCIIALWSVGYTVGSKDIQRREAAIHSNTLSINKTREETGAKIAEMAANIKAIKDSQDLMLQAFGIKKEKNK